VLLGNERAGQGANRFEKISCIGRELLWYSFNVNFRRDFSAKAGKKRLTADFFLALQFVLAAISGGSQFVRLLTTSQGLNISWLASWLAFLLINLALVIRAHRAQPSRVTSQTVLSYGVWTVAIAANLALLLWEGTVAWDVKDWLTTAVVGLGLLATMLWSRVRRLSWRDPVVHGLAGLCFIGLPQVTLAYKIFEVGGAGLAGGMLLAGHVAIITRLGQLGFAIREAGWDRNRIGAAISEAANEVTWLLVTAAWLRNH
jgi:hypothetical protein